MTPSHFAVRPSSGPTVRHVNVGTRCLNALPRRPKRTNIFKFSCHASLTKDAIPESTAAGCVDKGLELFRQGQLQTALNLFQSALKLNPNEDEARAAYYNSACALAKLGRWQEAGDSVVTAVNEYGLKLKVAVDDPDLGALRERREWMDVLERATGGVSGSSYVKLRSEAKAPFRLTRILLFGALLAGASLGLLIISTRLLSALQGGDGAPDLTETTTNFGINAAAVGLFGFLIYRDLAAQRRDEQVVEREEALGTLELSLPSGRTIPLASLRGTSRPIIIMGNKGHLSKALAAAQRYRKDFVQRGICIVQVPLNNDDPEERLRQLKAELTSDNQGGTNTKNEPSKGFGSPTMSKGMEGDSNLKAINTASENPDKAKSTKQIVFEAANIQEWVAWIEEQSRASRSKSPGSAGSNYYVQIQLDGTVRASGVGMPPWAQFMDDIPELDSLRTKLSDGRGLV
jgi:tetratricopeptide (TPR) repeat protein